VTRHAQALRPLRRAEFGTGDAAPSEGHIQAVNRLVGSLRRGLLKVTGQVTNAAEGASRNPTSQNLQETVTRKEHAPSKDAGESCLPHALSLCPGAPQKISGGAYGVHPFPDGQRSAETRRRPKELRELAGGAFAKDWPRRCPDRPDAASSARLCGMEECSRASHLAHLWALRRTAARPPPRVAFTALRAGHPRCQSLRSRCL
jgi:hypothetical protein